MCKAGKTRSASVCLPVSCVLHIPGETWRSKEPKLGGTGGEKSLRRSLVGRIKTEVIVSVTGSGLTDWDLVAGELQEKTTVGQGKWRRSGKWEKVLLEDQPVNIYFLKDFY